MSEASPAMKWANKYDKDAIREAYLANSNQGRGLGEAPIQTNGHQKSQDTLKPEPIQPTISQERDLPAVPPPEYERPTIPLKAAAPPVSTPPVAPFSPTPQLDEPEEEQIYLSEKAAEVALPKDPHPTERQISGSSSPVPPPPLALEKVETYAASRPSADVSGSSPESRKRHNKLRKKQAGGGGFKKMFGRNKQANMNGSQLQPTISRDQKHCSIRRCNPRTPLLGLQKENPCGLPRKGI